MIEAEFWDYDSEDEMAAAVAGDVGFIIESAIDARGNALIALPGGSTPGAIFAKLAEASLPWKKVTIIPTDDRLVTMDNELSNIRMIAGHFIRSGARIFPIAADIADYRPGGQFGRCAAAGPAVAARPGVARHGRGRAHRVDCSPAPTSQDALDAPKARRAVGVMPDPLPAEAPVARVTLTRASILAAKTILITITGQKKRDLLEQAIEDGHSSKLPIGRVLAECDQPIDIHWRP